MAATTPLSTERPGPGRLLRFDVVERAVHWVTAVLFAVVIATAAVLYLEPLQKVIGRRALVEGIHVWCGLALPVPVLIGVVGWWGRGLRDDLTRINRWSPDDKSWMRAVLRRREVKLAARAELIDGKFNAGQKLNTAFTAGVMIVMGGTGAIMRWYHPWPLPWRTGATFVHDWLAAALVVVIIGHVALALRDPEAMASMRSGSVSRRWAARHAPGWLHEIDREVR